MTDFFTSFTEWIKEKNNSSVYAVFIFAFIAWNWRMFYTLFFESATLLANRTRLSQAETYSHHINSITFGSNTISNPILIHLVNYIILFGIPALVTYLIIWWLPYVYESALARQLKFHFARKELLDIENDRYQNRKTEHLKSIGKAVAEQSKVLDQIATTAEKNLKVESSVPENIFSREKVWDIEYEELKSGSKLVLLGALRDFIYKSGGELEDKYNRATISTEDLAYADTAGLVELKKNSADVYQLTAKGKFFLKRYLGNY